MKKQIAHQKLSETIKTNIPPATRSKLSTHHQLHTAEGKKKRFSQRVRRNSDKENIRKFTIFCIRAEFCAFASILKLCVVYFLLHLHQLLIKSILRLDFQAKKTLIGNCASISIWFATLRRKISSLSLVMSL